MLVDRLAQVGHPLGLEVLELLAPGDLEGHPAGDGQGPQGGGDGGVDLVTVDLNLSHGWDESGYVAEATEQIPGFLEGAANLY